MHIALAGVNLSKLVSARIPGRQQCVLEAFHREKCMQDRADYLSAGYVVLGFRCSRIL